MQRPQKTAKAGYTCEGMLETESNKGACSVARLETERQDGAENLLEAVLDRNNLNKAYLKVKKNGGSAGIDGYYYYFDGSREKVLAPEETTSELKIAIKNFKEEFNVVVIQENTPALYDENGAAYSDWDRSELVVTNKEGVPVSVKK